MKIIIIGAQGFIGSNAAKYFKELGHEVWGCGVSESPDEKNYFQVERFFPDYNNIFKLQQFDICINASGSPGVAFSMEHPQDDFRMNVSNVYALLNAIRIYNPECKFVNLSSAAVYGSPDLLPIREDTNLEPLSPYGYHKMLTEQIVNEFHQIFNMPTCSFRIFSAYGPGIKKQLLWDIYQKAMNSEDGYVNLFGKGNETRDFIYITDLLCAINLALSQCEFKGEVYNLGSGNETTIKEVASLFLEIINPLIKLNFNNIQKPGDPLFWKADIRKLTKYNFKTVISLKEGLNLYYQWLISEGKR
jgi:dTDP-glucose 4,6-dehydratase/UDP-glucose 4-epimerase